MFLVRSYSDCYAGKWIVIRESDYKLVFESTSIREALMWVKTWGHNQGISKKGRELSPKVLERIKAK